MAVVRVAAESWQNTQDFAQSDCMKSHYRIVMDPSSSGIEGWFQSTHSSASEVEGQAVWQLVAAAVAMS
jgi:hypothetical protein